MNNVLTSLNLDQNPNVESIRCRSNQLTSLDVSSCTNLIQLLCYLNQLTNLNISSNPNLIALIFGDNQLTNLDVSNSPSLFSISCYENLLSNIDVSSNPALVTFFCNNNQLTHLDISQNPILTRLWCHQNELTCLNFKNGNNINTISFVGRDNSNLTCIEVDDSIWSINNWTQLIDSTSSFSTNCNNVCSNLPTSLHENDINKYSIYPNPTTGPINIDLGEDLSNVKATLTNGLGQVVITKKYPSTNYISLDIDGPKGIYFLQLQTESGEVITKKIVKE